MSNQADLKIHLECNTLGPTGGKFWIAEVYGSKVVVRWGPRGKSGQSKEYLHGSQNSAIGFVLDKEQEKLGKGYYEVSHENAPCSPAKSEPSPPDSPPAESINIVSNESLLWDF